jgi:hypothetical protein
MFPLTVDVARLDTESEAFDPIFKTRTPGVARVELPPIRLHAQIEMGRWQAMNQTQAGNIPDSRLTLVFHFDELEAKGLVDPDTGNALLRVNDRLVALYDRTGAIIEQSVGLRSGGLFATEVQPAGLGLGGRRNLLVTVWDDRPQGLAVNP